MFRIWPPEQVAGLASVQTPAFPATVKLPEVLERMMPFGPPLVETLVRMTLSGVVPPPHALFQRLLRHWC